MTSEVYPMAFARAGIDLVTPPAADRKRVDDVIFRELCQGLVRDESRVEVVRIIDDLKRSGCDAVALACTELPLLVSPEASALPTLDSTRLLARAAVAVACGDSPLPAWRGGSWPVGRPTTSS
jgi:aspartate racemase